ncbi:hypothetical protein LCGC14_1457550 [marine sediment metagenome]|uniref:Uncharacterized protein n=1 Tax=marine sediment metagenome TaxID=412755 RepID=A0A0F9LWQ8_9ZZZZ
MLITRENYLWLKEHTYFAEDNTWRCRLTEMDIRYQLVSQLLEFSGGGELRAVIFLYCSVCTSLCDLPRFGDSVRGKELINVTLSSVATGFPNS